jgi:hypothetical protein
MAIVPTTQKFHTVASNINTVERGSALSNAGREIYTMQDIIDTTRPYKVFTAIVNQSGTNEPVVTVLENTIDSTLTLVRTSVGVYRLSGATWPGAGPFTVGKTVAFSGSNINSAPLVSFNNNSSAGVATDNAMIVRAYDTSFAITDGLNNLSIEVRVYP